MKFWTWYTSLQLVFIAIDIATHASRTELGIDALLFAFSSAMLIAKIPMKKR